MLVASAVAAQMCGPLCRPVGPKPVEGSDFQVSCSIPRLACYTAFIKPSHCWSNSITYTAEAKQAHLVLLSS